MELPEFLRLNELRSKTGQIVWMLGAGASSSAGIPTAADITIDLKRAIYCSEIGKPTAAVTHIDHARLQTILNDYFQGRGGFPAPGAPEEYSAYFECAFPNVSDRQQYIQDLMVNRRPSYGHRVLGELVRTGRIKALVTTNFDKLIEQAISDAFRDVSKLIVADLGEPDKASAAINSERWPLLMKLHGDFHSKRLKNSTPELQEQDKDMRRAMLALTKRYGLAVVGYSGRDASIMDTLEAALREEGAFPGGLFWFHRAGEQVHQRVSGLIEGAATMGCDAHFIEVETFDELFTRIAQSVSVRVDLAEYRQDSSVSLALPPPSKAFPIVRTNAFRILSFPVQCRRVSCKIGGQREVEEALGRWSGSTVLARRGGQGVLAFGEDAAIRTIFEPFDIDDFDLHAISIDRLQDSYTEKQLLLEAATQALSSNSGLPIVRRRGRRYITAQANLRVAPFNESSSGAISSVTGKIPKTRSVWFEACEINLERRVGALWLLLTPVVITEREGAPTESEPESEAAIRKAFVKEKTARRYNKQLNSILDGWVSLLLGGKRGTATIRALGIAAGIDAEFEISRVSAFSGRYQ